MQTCKEIHELLAAEMLRDLPITEVKHTMTGASMSGMLPVFFPCHSDSTLSFFLSNTCYHYGPFADYKKVKYFETHSTKAKNIILHHRHDGLDYPTECALDATLCDLLKIFDGSESLEVFGFTSASSVSDRFYEHVIRLLSSHVSLRVLLIPKHVDREWRYDTDSIFDAHVRVRRDDPDTEAQHL